MKRLGLIFSMLLAGSVAGAPPVLAQVGGAFCFGLGCPCGNDDPNAGCGNKGVDFSFSTGAELVHSGGVPSALQDSFEFTVRGMSGNQLGLVYMGAGSSNFVFGDGLRCVVSAGLGIRRFPVQQADFVGEFIQPGIVGLSQGFPPTGQIQPGETWYFQGWYRDPGGPCGSSFNLTNAVPVSFYPGGGGGNHSHLAGQPLAEYPWFDYCVSINQGQALHMAVDPLLQPGLVGLSADVYIVRAKDSAGWSADPTLTDARGAPSSILFSGADVQGNTFQLDAGLLSGTSGSDLGQGYDVVIDVDGDGLWDAGEPIDGLSTEAGFYVVRDVAAAGPYTVTEVAYSGGSWLGQNLFYPASIASLGALPLVVVSHGNGHNYTWYDHIGTHLASYGFVVMSHQNETAPGIETASTTTLTNTDYFLGNLASIAAGALAGHIDSSRIAWIGHSRGGEGVVRAYTRLATGHFVPANYTQADIQLVSSIAPVTFLASTAADPGSVNYHLWVGSADDDVNGLLPQTHQYAILERAQGARSSITIQGAGHGAFHNGGGSLVAAGPCLLTRVETHQIMRGQLLPLVKHYLEGDIPARDFLWRQWEGFKPIGAPPLSNPCAVVTFDYRPGPAGISIVLDDFNSNAAKNVSSSGTAVSFTVDNLFEDNKRDTDGSFTWTGSQPMNGMTRTKGSEEHPGLVFDWNEPSYWEVQLPLVNTDVTGDTYLSFRACQGTRHPNTTAALGDLTFFVTLRDANGVSSSISCGLHGGGIEEPYQRPASNPTPGWANEMETVRIRLSDFLANGSGINLTILDSVRLDFGGPGGDAVGRLGFDDFEITRE
ncbi:MAG TPA: hypothetical protein EYG30_07410 [Planctomycetes bacterium]|nr:hypothetical protein [Planctomycetota bacterium]HIL52067.1 hypothetical protein [Planctomycetota bacterium]